MVDVEMMDDEEIAAEIENLNVQGKVIYVITM